MNNYQVFLYTVGLLLLVTLWSGCTIGIPIEQTENEEHCYSECKPLGNGDEYCEQVCY